MDVNDKLVDYDFDDNNAGGWVSNFMSGTMLSGALTVASRLARPLLDGRPYYGPLTAEAMYKTPKDKEVWENEVPYKQDAPWESRPSLAWDIPQASWSSRPPLFKDVPSTLPRFKPKYPAYPVLTMPGRRRIRRRKRRKLAPWMKNRIKQVVRGMNSKMSKPMLWLLDDSHHEEAGVNTRLILQVNALDESHRDLVYTQVVKPYLEDISDDTFPASIVAGTPTAPYFRFSVTGIKNRVFLHNVYTHACKAHIYIIRYKNSTDLSVGSWCTENLIRRLGPTAVGNFPLHEQFNVWLSDVPGFNAQFKVLKRETCIFSPGQTREVTFTQPFWTYNRSTADDSGNSQTAVYNPGSTCLFMMVEGPPRHQHTESVEDKNSIGNVKTWIEWTAHKRAKVHVKIDEAYKDFGAVTEERQAITDWENVTEYTVQPDDAS